jgi:hypothetical protein
MLYCVNKLTQGFNMDRLIRFKAKDWYLHGAAQSRYARDTYVKSLVRRGYNASLANQDVNRVAYQNVIRICDTNPSADTIFHMLASDIDDYYIEPIGWLDKDVEYYSEGQCDQSLRTI